MGQCLEIEEFGWNIDSLLGICKVRTDCIAESIGKDADNVSTGSDRSQVRRP